ncbi:MAG: DUF2892 domain-containing protein [Spirochaetes bacterium]|nr:DUF2892 domain-containing protein [Spirochaetota bacterium]
MNKNIGSVDRYLRFLVGMALLLNVIILDVSRVAEFIIALFGVILVVTSITGFCLLYVPLKICTIPGCECKSDTEAKA